MKLWKINDISEFGNLMTEMFISGALDMLDESIPLFEDHESFYRFFDITDSEIHKIHNENGNPNWNIDENILPINWRNKQAATRIKNIGLKIPFYVVTAGHRGWDIMGNVNSKTFYEIQDVEKT